MSKVMLVEDDINLREIYAETLMAEGYDIVTAKDGEEALALVVKEKPDLIISDIMMPKISGFDLLDILRATPETKHTKVVMMTALSQAEDKDRAGKLGADRYLVKSQVTIDDVAKVVHELLEDNPTPTSETLPTNQKLADTTPPQPTPTASQTPSPTNTGNVTQPVTATAVASVTTSPNVEDSIPLSAGQTTQSPTIANTPPTNTDNTPPTTTQTPSTSPITAQPVTPTTTPATSQTPSLMPDIPSTTATDANSSDNTQASTSQPAPADDNITALNDTVDTKINTEVTSAASPTTGESTNVSTENVSVPSSVAEFDNAVKQAQNAVESTAQATAESTVTEQNKPDIVQDTVPETIEQSLGQIETVANDTATDFLAQSGIKVEGDPDFNTEADNPNIDSQEAATPESEEVKIPTAEELFAKLNLDKPSDTPADTDNNVDQTPPTATEQHPSHGYTEPETSNGFYQPGKGESEPDSGDPFATTNQEELAEESSPQEKTSTQQPSEQTHGKIIQPLHDDLQPGSTLSDLYQKEINQSNIDAPVVNPPSGSILGGNSDN